MRAGASMIRARAPAAAAKGRIRHLLALLDFVPARREPSDRPRASFVGATTKKRRTPALPPFRGLHCSKSIV